jgi:hypothetical protein
MLLGGSREGNDEEKERYDLRLRNDPSVLDCGSPDTRIITPKEHSVKVRVSHEFSLIKIKAKS